MSGPKVSSYELAEQQREWLRREREEQERRERERREREREQRRIEVLKKKFTDMQSTIIECATTCNKFIQGLDESRYDASALRRFVYDAFECKQLYGDFSAICGHGTQAETFCEEKLQHLLYHGKEIEEMMSNLQQTRRNDQYEMAKRMLREYRERQQAFDSKRNQEHAERAENLYNTLMTKLSEMSLVSVEQKRVEEAREKLQKIKHEYMSQPDKLYEKMHFFQIDDMQHLVEDVKQAEFRRRVRDRYESLCAVAQVTPLQYDDAYAITIEHACEALEKALDEHRSKAYARHAILECMEELGYRFVGERSNQAQEPTMQYLYRIDGTENVLRVTCSAGGQTVIEIGKGDRINRVAEPREIKGLVADMKVFCSDGFPAIIQKLSEKGVHLAQQAWLPPTEDYAQIIDMTPFLEEVNDCSLQSMYDQIVTRELMMQME